MKTLYRLNFLGNSLPHLIETEHNQNFLRKHLWKYDYLITKILFKHIYRAHSNDGDYYRVSGAELMKKMGQIRIDGTKRRAHSVIRDDLKKWGIILYRNELRTEGEGDIKEDVFYKIIDEVRTKGWQKVNYRISPLIKEKTNTIIKWKGVHKIIFEEMQHLSIHPIARIYCEWALKNRIKIRPRKRFYSVWDMDRQFNEEVYSAYMMIIETYESKNFELKINFESSGRCYYPLVYTPKTIRPFVRYKNLPLYEVDVRNSQPLLLCPGLKEWVKNNMPALPVADIEEYQRLCENGEFYSHVQNLMELAGEKIQTETFKPDFFEKIFFSTERKQWKWRKLFDEAFPTVSKYITHLKERNHANAALSLQNREAKIMIHDALNSIYKDGHRGILILHDAMYCTEDKVELVKERVIQAYNRAGVNPRVKITALEKEYDTDFLEYIGKKKGEPL